MLWTSVKLLPSFLNSSLFTCLPIHQPTCLPNHSLAYSLTYSFTYLLPCLLAYVLTYVHIHLLTCFTGPLNNVFSSHSFLFVSTRIPMVKSVLLYYWILKELMLSEERALMTMRSLLFLFCCPPCWFTIRLVFQKERILLAWSILFLNIFIDG